MTARFIPSDYPGVHNALLSEWRQFLRAAITKTTTEENAE